MLFFYGLHFGSKAELSERGFWGRREKGRGEKGGGIASVVGTFSLEGAASERRKKGFGMDSRHDSGLTVGQLGLTRVLTVGQLTGMGKGDRIHVHRLVGVLDFTEGQSRSGLRTFRGFGCCPSSLCVAVLNVVA